MSVARKTRAAALMLAAMATTVGCKNKTADNNGEVTVVGMTPLPVATSAAAPTPTGIVNAGMADLTPQAGPSSGPVMGANPAGGGAANPFASPITPLPAKLPRDPGGAAALKIVPMKIVFAGGRTADGAAQLTSDGSLLFDGTRAGKMSGNKITLKKAPLALALRSDGFITVASPKGTFFKRDAVGVTSQTGFRLRIGPDNASLVADAPGGGQFAYGQVNIPLLDDATKTTALMIASTEAARIPDAPPPPVAQGSVAQKNVGAPAGLPNGTYSFDLDLSKATITPGRVQDIPPAPPDPPTN